MKKYLLLASVAGCLLGANAWAESADANITAEVSIDYGCTIANTNDMEFGTVVLASDDLQNAVLYMDKAGDITKESGAVISFDESASSGAASVLVVCKKEANIALDYLNNGFLEGTSGPRITDATLEELQGDISVAAGTSENISFDGGKGLVVSARINIPGGTPAKDYTGQVLKVTLTY